MMTQSIITNADPFVENVYKVVSLPFTQEQTSLNGVKIPPNSLRLVQNLHAQPILTALQFPIRLLQLPNNLLASFREQSSGSTRTEQTNNETI
jgi:hypothetical protein